jgi:Galactose oxidase, central domain
MRSQVASLRRLFFSATIRSNLRTTRALILVSSISLAVTAWAVVAAQAGSFQGLFFGVPSGVSGHRLAQPKAALANSLLNASAMTLDSRTMTAGRSGHTASRLPDGRVLIAGGENSSEVLNQCEIFDPSSVTFSIAGNMGSARVDHSATLLSDGRVLIAGGRDAVGAVNTIEVFDPASGAFTAGPIMGVARAGHRATLLSDRRVLIAGGDVNGSAEIFDSTAGSFSVGGATLITARSKHSAALLMDGRVLIVGGTGSNGSALSSEEIFDPATPSGGGRFFT